MARHLARASAALALALVAACGGGSDAKPAKTSPPPARVELTDLAASPSGPSATYDTPLDLRLPDESWREGYRKVATRLSSMLRASMMDPAGWQLTSDKAAYKLVYGAFDVTESSGSFVANSLYKQARSEAEPRERIGHRVASIFPKDAMPRRVYAYKIGWTAQEVKGGLKVSVQAWVGYDVGKRAPVLIARELGATIVPRDGYSDYRVSSPQIGTYADSCSSPVDGVFRPSSDGLDRAMIPRWKKETGSSTVRPLKKAFIEVAASGGSKVSEAKTRASVKKCLAEAAAKKS
ncbi:hypothetical protein [Aeromicrobium chenweiae]|uniref:Uncharacterized protein n=1 Tax=Aeromicrobium chenweiae TaxID=2079793 RepID=A0A2S0WMJ5_9ACTN|nr:hypothetical protein [Aeromicrobium chenweiae]AWB92522.1 hypothetical protein C3E78_10105 [Aeromicrobium chenweiae]TGN33508.1 hypothetical protein E4L97_00145 [Aeromicrobium chenweiae]